MSISLSSGYERIANDTEEDVGGPAVDITHASA